MDRRDAACAAASPTSTSPTRENGIYESNEDNNEAQTIVRLPFRERQRRRGCRGSDRGRTFDPTDPYYTVG